MKAIDLFAGAGGLSTGLEMAGFDVIFANEVSEVFSSSLKKNHPNTEVLTDDIRSLEPKKIMRSLGINKGELELLAGGPPCQGFSVNAPERSSSDERNHLFQDFLRFVEEFQPKTVLIENVPGIVSFEKGDTVKAILTALERLDYKASVRILYAPHYGVPQMRWRTIFLATRLNMEPLFLFPKPEYSLKGRANFTSKLGNNSLLLEDYFFTESVDSFVTVHDAIRDLPPIPNKGGQDDISFVPPFQSQFTKKLRRSDENQLFNHVCAGLGKANLERLPFIPQGGSWRDIPHDLLPTGMKRARRTDHTQRYGRLSWDGIGSTILTKCDPHWGRFIHPEQDRVISVREAARIQSFPDQCRFMGSLSEQYMQVGNAVPPLFAFALGNRIKEMLTKPEASRDFANEWFGQRQLSFA